MTLEQSRFFHTAAPFAALLLVGFMVVQVAGCAEREDPAVVTARRQVLFAEKPSVVQSIEEAKELADPTVDEQVPGEPAPEDSAEVKDAANTPSPVKVTIIGRIDAGDFDPFERDRAAFMLTELPRDHDGQEGHDPSTCPFCKRKAEKAPRAHVTLMGKNDQPITISAPDLLGVAKGDQVIVHGNALWEESLGTLQVTASRIYLVQ